MSLFFCYSFYMFPAFSKLWEDNSKSIEKGIQVVESLKDVTPVVWRLDALSRLERLRPEMMSHLLPYLKRLAVGVQLGDIEDDRSMQEAVNVARDIDIILDGWHFAEVEVLRDEVKKKEQKEENEYKERMRNIEQMQTDLDGILERRRENLERRRSKPREESEKDTSDKVDHAGDIDLERGISKGRGPQLARSIARCQSR
jgi:hypothetical protein